jgi:hypothetical protein
MTTVELVALIFCTIVCAIIVISWIARRSI